MSSNNLIETFAVPVTGEDFTSGSGRNLLISISGKPRAPLSNIEQLGIVDLKDADLSRYELLYIEILDQDNIQGGIIAHSVFRPDGRAIEIMDYNEVCAYASVGIMNIMLGLLSNGPSDDSDWSIELLNDQNQRDLQ